MKKLILYIHGKGGSAAEAEHYKPLCRGFDVYGLDYKGTTPWETKEEFERAFGLFSEKYDEIVIIANSVGAYFTMNALSGKNIKKALFISPIVNMEKLICDMMTWANVTEDKLREKGEIATDFGEMLSWEYLAYVRANPLRPTVPTQILYGGKDNLTSRETVTDFALKHGFGLTVMEDGEHWFHTDEQMKFLDEWVNKVL